MNLGEGHNEFKPAKGDRPSRTDSGTTGQSAFQARQSADTGKGSSNSLASEDVVADELARFERQEQDGAEEDDGGIE